MTKVRRFLATLEKEGSRLQWTIVRIPFDVKEAWGSQARRAVRGTINGYPFRTSIFPSRRLGPFLMVNKEMQKGAKAGRAGEVVRITIAPDLEERTVQEPKELLRALARSRPLRRYYDRLNYSTRREIARWVGEAKQAQTRARRAEQMAERLLETMEGEREAPPILRAALARDPRARAAWEVLPPSHRRRHLLAITYYRDPVSRARRVAKCVAQIAEWAERRKKS
jgi:uncharacterized protein YdeI (YjbR/CyaY-like superfamily)